MNNKKFSVVIPLYNKEKYIKRTIESVLNQTFTDFEIIIIDDGSKDKSCEIVESINDPRIRLIRQENGGPSKARNRGIKEAKGAFIAFLDADDEWLLKKLKNHYEFHSKNPDVLWSCTGYRVEGGKRVEQIIYPYNDVLDDALEAIIDGLSITSSTVVIKKSIFNNKDFLFNESMKRSEDREVWYKIACLYPTVGHLRKILSIIHVNTLGSLCATGLDETDFSFLSLSTRIEKQLSCIENKDKKRFLGYLQHLNQKKMLSLWGWNHSFKQISKHFEPYIHNNILIFLIRFDFMPLIVKKVFVKLYLATVGRYR